MGVEFGWYLGCVKSLPAAGMGSLSPLKKTEGIGDSFPIFNICKGCPAEILPFIWSDVDALSGRLDENAGKGG